MAKVNVVMIVLNAEFLERAIQNLNFDRANLATIIMDGDEKFVHIEEKKFPVNSFADVLKTVKKYKDFIWLIVGYKKSIDDILKMKKFLMSFDVSEKNIVNFEMPEQTSLSWLANLRYIEKHSADFFATGDKHTQNGLNLDFIPCVYENKNFARGGVNLAYPKQDLQQSYLTARYVFNHVIPGTIKFVLIGLTPDSFRRDNGKNFFGFRQFLSLATTAAQPDLNFETVKISYKRKFSLKAAVDWKDNQKVLPEDAVEKNIQILKDYIELCLANGAKPIGLVFPFTLLMHKTFDEEVLKSFRETIRRLEENYDFMCVDMFDLEFGYHRFQNMTYLNMEGRRAANAVLSMKLYTRKLLPIENFLDMDYDFFDALARVAPKEEYNTLIGRVLNLSVKKIRNKKNIKVGFVLYDTSMWCGDELYNFFVNNKRFEPTVFLCLRMDSEINDSNRDFFIKNLASEAEKLREHGLNVVVIEEKEAIVPEQDVLIYLTPYLSWLPSAFRPRNITPNTLMTYILYGLDSSYHVTSSYSQKIFLVGWEIFFPSVITFDLYRELTITGMPRGFCSGYPRMDIFFDKKTKFEFDWKMARPDAKKIIWAPHWSIIGGPAIKYATFQWNYQFMYEFAKAHPEISWVVKPHPNLFYSAVNDGVFPSLEAFKEYLQAWDDLPNARVYTGGYYQDVFATSDGMIHDCGSFTAEYQYMHKPMIYLTRDTQKHNKLGEEILKVSYLVDGQDLDGIAATVQKVFIEGNDDKADERKKLFDKYLNYPKLNGMLAGKFIYRHIADKFKKQKH